jgi:DNA-binding XRE family transcriptional regulator
MAEKKRNGYLLHLGSNLLVIRQILNITQEELAKMMELSRPTIVKLEQEPDKMTKALAFALFGVVTIEIKRRLKNLKSIDPKEYSEIQSVGKLVNNLKDSTSFSIPVMGAIATKGLGRVMPGIGSVVSSGLKNGWKSLKDTALTSLKDNAQWDEKKAEIIVESVEKQLLEDQEKLLTCFKLNAFDIELFGEELEKGEDEDYELWGL